MIKTKFVLQEVGKILLDLAEIASIEIGTNRINEAKSGSGVVTSDVSSDLQLTAIGLRIKLFICDLLLEFLEGIFFTLLSYGSSFRRML
jgi:hypothetical protein